MMLIPGFVGRHVRNGFRGYCAGKPPFNFSLEKFEAGSDITPQKMESEIGRLQAEVRDLWAKRDLENAKISALECRKLSFELFGPVHPVTASAVNNIAMLTKEQGDFEEAVELFTEAIGIYKEAVGDTHTNFGVALNNLASTYKMIALSTKGMKRHQMLMHAKELYDDLLVITTINSGRDHPSSGVCIQNKGAVTRLLGQNDSLEMVEEGLEIILTSSESTTIQKATALNNLGLELKNHDRLEEALESYIESKALYEKSNLAEKHPSRIVLLHNIAELYLAQGNNDEAIKIQEGILELLEYKEG